MAENEDKPDEASGNSGTRGTSGAGGAHGAGGGFFSRFGGGFATIAGGVAAFALMLVIGGFVAFQLLGGPGDGSAPGPLTADGPSSAGGGSGQSGRAGSGDGFEDPREPANPRPVTEPDDQSRVRGGQGEQRGVQPSEPRPADFALRLSKRVAEPYENVRWRGSFPGGQGQRLVLQNKQGADWVDYLEDATVGGDGRYRGSLQVGATGVNEFRVVDPSSGSVSNVVSIEIF